MKKTGFWAGLAAAFVLLLAGCGKKEADLSIGSTAQQIEETQAGPEKELDGKAETEGDANAAKSIQGELTPVWSVAEQPEEFADYTVGTFVAGYNVLDYGADPAGKEDNTKIFQALLDSLGDLGGGTLYVPEGMYRFDGFLRVPKGVTLRGDWKKPEKGGPVEGTVLMAYAGAGLTNEDLPFITLVLGSGVMDVAIWYPEQDPENIQPYSPAITMGQQGYFGNEYNNVKNVTFVNAYTGVHFSYVNSGACPIVSGAYGTTLETGVEIDDIGDVGRVEHVSLSPSYWISCGLYERMGMEDPFERPGAEKALREYMYRNASGINMRRNDWTYTCYVDVEGYQYGFQAMKSAVKDSTSMPNGHNYGLHFKDCQTAIEIRDTANAGIMFTYVDIEDCENGIVFEAGASGPAQFQGTRIAAADQAVYMDLQSGPKVQMNECTIESGAVTVDSGVADIVDCDFENAEGKLPHVSIGLSGRVNMVGNRYNGERNVVNKSLFASNFSDEDAQMEKLPEYVEVKPQEKLPASMALYLVTDYGAASDGETDCTEAVRQALKDASDGGGIVFFPPGHYRFDSTLTVPAGVELRGACDNSTLPHGEGTILEVYCGEGDAEGEPFLQLKEGSGLRGLSINYPNQIYTGTKEVEPDYAPIPYPYTIQGQGKDIYIINVGLRASYMGLDMYTYPCDDHYIDYITGQIFNVGLRFGNCSGGILMNMQCNTICYAYGYESKFGSFPNSPAKGVSNQPVYDYAFYNLDNLVIGDCENELLYNDFNFGAHRGIVFVNDGNGGPKNLLAIGLGLDKDCRAYYFEEGLSGATLQFVNTQVVSTEAKEETEYIYSEKENDFHAVIYGGDFWGNPSHFVRMGENSGTLVVQNGRMNHPGRETFAVMEGGSFKLKASLSQKMSGTAEITGGAKVEFLGNVLDNTGVNTDDYVWADNLAGEAEMAQENAVEFLDRKKWTADASHNAANAGNALDGNLNTRWDTAEKQAKGQWFMVDLGEPTEFDCIFLEFSGSSGDAPAEYEVLVSDDGTNWSEPIASGEKGSGIIPVESQKARYIKINQNGTGGGYWSIHEFYLLDGIGREAS